MGSIMCRVIPKTTNGTSRCLHKAPGPDGLSARVTSMTIVLVLSGAQCRC